MVRNDCVPTYELAPSTIEPLSDKQLQPDLSISPIDDSIVIVYKDEKFDGDGYGICCTIMDSNWVLQKSRFQINTETTSDQVLPSVKHFPDGKFLVTWKNSEDKAIHGRVMLSDGQPYSYEITISENNNNECKFSEIAMFDDGTAIVVFNQAGNLLKGRFVYSDATMSSNEFTIRSSDVNYDSRPAVDVSDDQQSFFVLHNYDDNIYAGQYSKNDGSLITNYGVILGTMAYNPGVVTLPNDDMIFVYTEASGSSVIKTSFYDQSSVQNTTQVESNIENEHARIAKGRSNLVVLSYVTNSNQKVSNYLLDPYNNQMVADFEIYSDSYCGSISLDAYDLAYSCVWESNDEIYGVKYNLKYPNYISGLDDQVKKIDEDFTLGFVFNDPESVGLTYQVKQADGSELPDWVIHSAPSSTQITGTTPTELSECNTQTFEFTVTTSKSCQLTDSKTFQIQVTDDPIATGAANFQDQTVQVSQSDWVYTFDVDCFHDPDEQDITYSSKLSNGNYLPDWLEFEQATRTFSSLGIPDRCNETLQIRVNASDHCSFLTRNFDLVIENHQVINNDLLLDQNDLPANSWFEYQFDSNSFGDPENMDLTYDCTLADGSPKPDWITFHSNNRTLNGITDQTKCDGDNIELKIIASDGCNSISDTFKMTFINQGVTKGGSIANQTKSGNSYLEYQIDANCFNDPEGVELTYSATLADGSQLPGWLKFHSHNRTFGGTVPADSDCDEFWEIKVIASDGCNNISSVFRLTSTNDDPSVNKAIGDYSYNANSQFQFQFDEECFDDPEGVELIYSATLADGSPLPDWVEFHSHNRTFQGKTMSDNCDEDLGIRVTASDHCNNVSNIFQFRITNNPISLQRTLEDYTFYVNNQFQFELDEECFDDPEGVELIYSATLADGSPLPDWVEFHSHNRTFQGKTMSDNCGEVLGIRVTASDRCYNASDVFQVSFNNPAPKANKQFERKTAIITIPFEYTFDPDTFVNEDGTELTYTAYRKGSTKLPDWLDFHSNNQTFSGRAENDLCSFLYEIIVTADDGCNNDSSSFYLELQNRKPIREKAFTDHSISVFEIIDYTIPIDSFSDPDDQDITLKAHLDPSDPREWPSWLNFNAKTGRFYGNASSCGDPYVIVIYGIDPCTEYASGNWTLTILDEPPEMNMTLEDQTFFVNAFNSYQFDNRSFIDPNGGSLDYDATLANGDPLPDWLEFDSNLRKFTGIASGCTQTQTVTVTAMDQCTSSVSQDFRISLVNNPIYEDKGLVDQEMNGNLLFNYTFALDAFGDLDKENKIYTYSIQCINPEPEKCPSWLVFQSKNRRFLGNTPNEDVKYTIKVYASDSCSSIRASSTFTITINKVQTENTKSDDANSLSTVNIVAYIVLSLTIIIGIIAFFIYRYYLQMKFKRLWDGKTEFFSAKMPNEKLYLETSSSSGSSFSSTESSQSDLEMQNQGDVNGEDRLHSDIDVSDMSNASDLSETDSSNSSSFQSSSSITDRNDE
ncbi:dystroglycan-related [Anaeramoeba flamelloides]|uniref:Dystroglycan-related n=1 Tax=Anaeramoeba flamelloides TaxID=1746091 RepID=A0AAV7ZC04_9EUKA|nr:dystroglycan-related [Anaeramoeba flamelloides]